jgi:formamidopyrimidine-DNA glycosylase
VRVVPELPDITVYLEALEARVLGRVLTRVRVLDLFVQRTARPPIDELVGKRVAELRRVGKRLALGFDSGHWLVVHLMVAGRLQWIDGDAKPKAKNVLAHFGF